ncbi:AmmeMemoRadiSam system radical SAM enzyme [Candidatus Peregrinibacteria bacterium]|nr:AmmeMemoRadiSam system radical SAM enzyme [Candidatus Peregrinibacteria bacterium]
MFFVKKAILYEKLPASAVRCKACSWYCKIPEGTTGICGVRENIKGDLYLLVYGKPIAVHIDPIEKKPLFHFLPGTEIFSIGTYGCSFSCDFCQNWDISQSPRELKIQYAADKKALRENLYRMIDACEDWPPEKIVEYCIRNKIPSIAYTYNEPAIFFEYAYDTAKLAREAGLKNIFVSNGFESIEAIEKISPYLDANNIDLKGWTEDFYNKICHARLAPVKENIKRFRDAGVWVEVTTLLIPGHNDSDNELKSIAEFLVNISPEIPWHVTAFHPSYKMQNVPSTPAKTLERAYKIGKAAGLKYVYTGNIWGLEGENTHCPKCSELLIKRSGASVVENYLKNDACPKCGFKIKGIWK